VSLAAGLTLLLLAIVGIALRIAPSLGETKLGARTHQGQPGDSDCNRIGSQSQQLFTLPLRNASV
jgi:hypothetical protein